MPAHTPKKKEGDKAIAQSHPVKLEDHPITKQTATKNKSDTTGDKGDHSHGQKGGQAKSNSKKKEDLDDMDEIFSSKPTKKSKDKIDDVGKPSSSGPDMAEIAKEAEKYKGSSSQGLFQIRLTFV